MRATFDSKSLTDRVVSRVKEIASSDRVSSQKISDLNQLRMELRRNLGETLNALSSARILDSHTAITILMQKKTTIEDCIAYVQDTERGMIRQISSGPGFYFAPRGFANPPWEGG